MEFPGGGGHPEKRLMSLIGRQVPHGPIVSIGSGPKGGLGIYKDRNWLKPEPTQAEFL